MVPLMARWEVSPDPRVMDRRVEDMWARHDLYPHDQVVLTPYLGEVDVSYPAVAASRPLFDRHPALEIPSLGREGHSRQWFFTEDRDWSEEHRSTVTYWRGRGEQMLESEAVRLLEGRLAEQAMEVERLRAETRSLVSTMMKMTDIYSEMKKKYLHKIHNNKINLKLKVLQPPLLQNNLLKCKINSDLQQSLMSLSTANKPPVDRSGQTKLSFCTLSTSVDRPFLPVDRHNEWPQKRTLPPLPSLPPFIYFLYPVSIYIEIPPLVAPSAKKMASRRRPWSFEAGQGSRAIAEHWTKHREDHLTELIIPPTLRLLDAHGTFTKVVQPRYIDFVSLEDISGELFSKVKQTPFFITPNLFSTALKIPNTGIDIKSHHPTLEEYHTLITLQPYDPTDRKQLNANSFPPLHHFIHHIFTTHIVPKDGSRELVTSLHKSLLHQFLLAEPINLPLLMVSILRLCVSNAKRSMPYACQLTSLFLFIGIQIPKEEMTVLKSRSSYDLTAAHRMGYKMVDGIVTRDLKGKGAAGDDGDDEEDEDVDGAEDEDYQSEPLDALGDATADLPEPSIRELLAQL
ncbi:hypothetical protein Taro_000925 [Colocasia esculenta]|uniref:Uncharacterized protein n=1 Tax=Colocasia esculenta TaxID=4460 RepID=A0A843TEI7_COLES|nr:hypothetical protein [Colocasia esculenta]